MSGGLLRGAFVVALAVLLAAPVTAHAVLEGTNGRIVMVSGRDGGDASANVYLRTIIGSAGGGSTGEAVASSPGQHRHPTWSPDRTMIAYARGDPSCTPGKCDIFVLDLTRPGTAPENITKTANVNEDRPAWSPDGLRIAYESEVSNGSGQTDILIDTLPADNPTNLTTTAGVFEGKPAWTPDSDTIFYHRGPPTVAGAMDILRRPADGGAASNVAAAPGISEFQPSISPDGTKMCFTRGDFTNPAATEVIVSLANGGAQTPLLLNAAGAADYNCTWSPDGTKIAWVQGAFSGGDLVMANSANDGTGFVSLEATAGAFDGNPDWAPDGRPECEDTTVATKLDTPVTIPLSCVDTGPAYERTPVTENIPPPGPTNGTLGTLTQGDPSTVTYTPNAGFSGTDTFDFNGFDAVQFAKRGTVTINVAQRLALTLAGKRKQKLDRAVEVGATCNNPCSAVVSGKLVVKTSGPGARVAQAKRSFKLKRARAELTPGAEQILKVKLSKKARRAAGAALADGGKVRAKLAGQATGDGETSDATLGVKLKRKRKG
jgi:Tol biopolymer transport system component